MSDYNGNDQPFIAAPYQNPDIAPMQVSDRPIGNPGSSAPAPALEGGEQSSDKRPSSYKRLLTRWGIRILILGGGAAVAVYNVPRILTGGPAQDINDIRRQAGYAPFPAPPPAPPVKLQLIRPSSEVDYGLNGRSK